MILYFKDTTVYFSFWIKFFKRTNACIFSTVNHKHFCQLLATFLKFQPSLKPKTLYMTASASEFCNIFHKSFFAEHSHATLSGHTGMNDKIKTNFDASLLHATCPFLYPLKTSENQRIWKDLKFFIQVVDISSNSTSINLQLSANFL